MGKKPGDDDEIRRDVARNVTHFENRRFRSRAAEHAGHVLRHPLRVAMFAGIDDQGSHDARIVARSARGLRCARSPGGVIHYHGKIPGMSLPQSKVTAQGQISVPAEIRRRLGIGPGSVLEWEQEGERVFVRKAGRYTFEDIHRAIFPKPPKPRTLAELKEGIERHMREKHARH